MKPTHQAKLKDTLIVPEIMAPKRKVLKSPAGAIAPSTRTTRSRAKSVEDQATVPPQDLAAVAAEPIAMEVQAQLPPPDLDAVAVPIEPIAVEVQAQLPPPDLAAVPVAIEPIAEEVQDQDLTVAGPSKRTKVSKALQDQTIP